MSSSAPRPDPYLAPPRPTVTPIAPPPIPDVNPQPRPSSGVPVWVVVLLVLGIGFVGLVGIAIVAAIAIPNLIEARKGSNEAAAIGGLRTITTAQALFRESGGRPRGPNDWEAERDPEKVRARPLVYAESLEKLGEAQYIDGKLASGTKHGYRFTVVEGGQFTWSATADPDSPSKSGDRYFFVDESGVIRFSTTGTANSQSTAIGG